MIKLRHLTAVLTIVAAFQASAAVLAPTAYFTLRSSTNAGPATQINTSSISGFLGFLSNLEGLQVDRTYLEFNMSAFGGAPVASATLDFFLGASPANVISMGSYSANGVPELADWFSVQTPVTSFNAGTTSAFSIDISGVLNANLHGPAFIGFGLSIDNPGQGAIPQVAFPQPEVPVINFTTTAVPEPSTLSMLILAMAAAALAHRRLKYRSARPLL